MHSGVDSQSRTSVSSLGCRSTRRGPASEVAFRPGSNDTTELVIRLPDRWRDPRASEWSSESAFRVVRYIGSRPDPAMLGEYALNRLVEGPIRSIVSRLTGPIPAGITTYLSISCLIDQIRSLFDAARSWAPGGLYRLWFRAGPQGSAHWLEVGASPELGGRNFLPRELLERGDGLGELADRLGAPHLTLALGDPTSQCTVETVIDPSGAWSIRAQIGLEKRDA
jgi:hypothetical protein